MVARVAMDTMPYNNRRLFRMLLCAKLSSPDVYSKAIDDELGIVRDTSLQRMDDLIDTGLAEPIVNHDNKRVGISLSNKYRQLFIASKAKNRWVLSRIPNFPHVDRLS